MDIKELKRTPICGMSDEELEAELAGFPSLDDMELVALKVAINEGIDSGIAVGFDPVQHLERMDLRHRINEK